MNREYLEPQPITREEATAAFESDDVDRICQALVSTVLFDPDRSWCEQWCQDFLRSEQWQLRAIAATCVGHLARLHGAIAPSTIQLVTVLRSDSRTEGQARNALEDIGMFVPGR